jgi:hypothetical protein
MPPIIDLATSVQKVAEAVVATIHATVKAKPCVPGREEAGHWAKEKIRAADRTATKVTPVFSAQILMRLAG